MPTRGLTLIELLMALVILAIITAVALPVYDQYAIRSYEAQAQADLMRCAAGMERHAARRFTYAGAAGGGDTGPLGDDICTPQSAHYDFSVIAADAAGFELLAEPRAGTAVQGRDALMIDAAGMRSWD